MKAPARRWRTGILLALAWPVALGVCGCSSSDTEPDPVPTASTSAAPVTVTEGKLSPTVSSSSSVELTPPLAVQAPKKGTFKPALTSDTMVKRGDVIGTIDNEKITAPTSGRISFPVDHQRDVPRSYPLAVIESTSFGIPVDMSTAVRADAATDVWTAKFQIQNGPGPHDCEAFLPTVNDTMDASGMEPPAPDSTSETEGHDSQLESSPPAQTAALSSTFICVIPTNVDVWNGASATTVAVGDGRSGVIVPISSVAGRSGTGTVNVITDGAASPRQVKLGPSDGTHIIITDGLKPGETISSTAPNLDARHDG